MDKVDVAAYVWPAFSGTDERSWIFWPEKKGEWESVKSSFSKFEGNDWPRRPLWGYQDEADKCVMEQQIEEAVFYGVNVFIYDWYWYDGKPFLENCLKEGFLKAKNKDKMKFYIMWANHDATSMWNKPIADPNNLTTIWTGKVDFEEFKKIVKYIIETIFSQPNYYKIDNKPVFSIYDLKNFIDGLGGIEKSIYAIEYFRDQVKKSGFEGLHLQMILTDSCGENYTGVDGKTMALSDFVIKVFNIDSLTHYQYVHFAKVDDGYEKLFSDVKKEYERIKKDYNIEYYPHASVGWDNNPRTLKKISYVAKENGPENFKKLFKFAFDYSIKNNKNKLITVNSWNEWTETSYLEPDDKFGYGYLEAIKEVIEQ